MLVKWQKMAKLFFFVIGVILKLYINTKNLRSDQGAPS